MAYFKRWDRVVVINLDESVERLDAFHESIATSSMLTSATVERFSAFSPMTSFAPTWYLKGDLKDGPSYNRYWACRQSHMAVWQKAILDNVEHLLVLEDDADILPEFDVGFTAFFMSMPVKWLGYSLGFFPWNAPENVNDRCDRSRGYGSTHAYGLNRQGLMRVYEHVEWHNRIVIDHALAGLHGEVPQFYAPGKELVKQRKGVLSDITGTVNDYSWK